MKTKEEVIAKIIEIGNDFSDYSQVIEKNLLPIGTTLRHRKVAGEKIASYSVEKNETGIGPSVTVEYITESGKSIGEARERLV